MGIGGIGAGEEAVDIGRVEAKLRKRTEVQADIDATETAIKQAQDVISRGQKFLQARRRTPLRQGRIDRVNDQLEKASQEVKQGYSQLDALKAELQQIEAAAPSTKRGPRPSRFYSKVQADEAEAKYQAFTEATKQPIGRTRNVPIRRSDMVQGKTFWLNGERVEVSTVKTDPQTGQPFEVTLKGGAKFGTLDVNLDQLFPTEGTIRFTDKPPKAPKVEAEQFALPGVEPEAPKPAAAPAEPQYPTQRVSDAMQQRGWAVHLPRDKQGKVDPLAVKIGKDTYPTIVSPDGKVRIALDATDLFERNGEVWNADPQEWKPDRLTVSAVITDPSARGRGLASAALKQLHEAADALGIRLVLEPRQMPDYAGKQALTTEQLASWYKRLGYTQQKKGSNLILERQPRTESPAPPLEAKPAAPVEAATGLTERESQRLNELTQKLESGDRPLTKKEKDTYKKLREKTEDKAAEKPEVQAGEEGRGPEMLSAAQENELINSGNTVSGEKPTLSEAQAAKQRRIREIYESSGGNAFTALSGIVNEGLLKGVRLDVAKELLKHGDLGVKFMVGGRYHAREWGLDAAGLYDEKNDTTHVYDDAFEHNKAGVTLLHEYVHALTHRAIAQGKFRDELESLFNAAYIKAQREGLTFHGLSERALASGQGRGGWTAAGGYEVRAPQATYVPHLHEFVAEALSNKRFQDFLERTRSPLEKGKLRTLFDDFVAWLAKVFGIKQSSALHDTIRIGLDLAGERARARDEFGDQLRKIEEKAVAESGAGLEWLTPAEEAPREDIYKNRRVYGEPFGPFYVQQSIEPQRARVKAAVFNADEPVTPERDRLWWRIFDQAVDRNQNLELASSINSLAQGDMGISILRNQMFAYAFKKGLEGDTTMLRSITDRIQEFGLIDPETQTRGASYLAYGLRGLADAPENELFRRAKIYRKEQLGLVERGLNRGWEGMQEVLDFVNSLVEQVTRDPEQAGRELTTPQLLNILERGGLERALAQQVVDASASFIRPEGRDTILETVYNYMKQAALPSDRDQFINDLRTELLADRTGRARLNEQQAQTIAEAAWQRKSDLVINRNRWLWDAELRRLDKLPVATVEGYMKRLNQPEWVKPEAPNNVRRILNDAIKSKEDPVDAMRREFVTKYADQLVQEGVPRLMAEGVMEEIFLKRQTDWSVRRLKTMQRAADSKNIASLVEALRESPYQAQSDPEWRRTTAENWFKSNGLSADLARRAAIEFDAAFVKSMNAAAERIAERLIKRSPDRPRIIKDLLEAISIGITNPGVTWVDALSQKWGFKTLKPEELTQLVKLQQKLFEPNLNPYEQVKLTEQMLGIYRHVGDTKGHFMQAVSESFSASLLSGIRTATLQVGQPGMHQLLVTALSVVSQPRDFSTLIRMAWNATKNFVPEFANAWVEDATIFETNSIGLWKNELKRQFEIAEKEFNQKQYHKAIPRFAYAWQQYVIRTLRSFDQASMAVMREYNLALYGSTAMRQAGLSTKQIAEMVQVSSAAKLAAYDKYIAAGHTKLHARAMADYDTAVALRQFFADERNVGLERAIQIDEAGLYDAFNVTGRKAPGIMETDEGMLSAPMNWLMGKVTEARGEGGAPSMLTIMAVGFCNVPFRTARYYAGWSPYGLLRWGVHNYMQSRTLPGAKWLRTVGLKSGQERETFWSQTYKNDLTAKQRLREAVAGTSLMLAFLGWQSTHSTADDDAEKRPFAMFTTGAGPSSRTLRDAWIKRGFQPYSLHVIVNGSVVAAIPTTRAGQILAYPLGIAAALDDVQWKRKQDRAVGRSLHDPISQELLTGVSTYYNIVGAQGIFQAAGHISQLGQGSGGMARAIGTTLAGTASAIAIPGKSLLQGVSDMIYGPVDRSSLQAAMVANVPFVNLVYNGAAINRFADPVGDRSWYATMTKLGAPIAFRVADTAVNREMYQMILDKGAAPPDLRRSVVEDKYGPLTQEEWSQFAGKSGTTLKQMVIQNLAGLKTMAPQDVKAFLNQAGEVANEQAAASLNLTPQKAVFRSPSGGAVARDTTAIGPTRADLPPSPAGARAVFGGAATGLPAGMAGGGVAALGGAGRMAVGGRTGLGRGLGGRAPGRRLVSGTGRTPRFVSGRVRTIRGARHIGPRRISVSRRTGARRRIRVRA